MSELNELIFENLQRDISRLSDDNKAVRKRSLEKIQKELLATSDSCVLQAVLDNGFLKILLKVFSDVGESCRNVAISTVTKCVVATKNPISCLPLITPIILSRFVSPEDSEPSEEIRLALIELLSLLITLSGIEFSPYVHDCATILRISVMDPYAEIKKESCRCCSKLAKAIPQFFYQESEVLAKPLLQSMVHQHSKVRVECVKAFGDIVQHGSASSINDGLPILAQRVCDQTTSVRVACVKIIGTWLLQLNDRYSYHHKLVPLLLTGLSDDVAEVQLLAQELWNKIGIQYQEENESFLKDQLDFSKPMKPSPIISFSRPNLGCRFLVSQCFSKILPAISKDLVDWTVDSRIKSSKLLVILLFHLEDQVTHNVSKILTTLYKACQDEERIVSREAARAAQLIGYYVNINIWHHLVLPAIKTSAGCQSSLESSIAVGPHQCSGCLLVLSNLLRGCFSRSERIEINFLKSIGGCLSEPEIGHSEYCPLLEQLLNCTEAVLSLVEKETILPNDLSLDLFTVILRVSSNQKATVTLGPTIDKVIVVLSEVQGMADATLLYSKHIESIVDSIKGDYQSWSYYSTNCELFASLLSGKMAHFALSSVLKDVIPIFAYCTSPQRNPEMQLKFISVLIDIIASSADFVKLHDGLCSDSVEIITTVFIPSCVWKGGRTAAVIRTAAMTGIQSLLVYHLVSVTQVALVLQQLLPQVLSCLDDDNSSTRKAACKVMNLLLTEAPQSFDVEQLHKLFCDLLKRLDDCQDDIRMETIDTFKSYVRTFPVDYDGVNLYKAHVEMLYKGLLVYLDDPDPSIQVAIFHLLQIASRLNSNLLCSLVKSVRDKHRSTSYCDEIILALEVKN